VPNKNAAEETIDIENAGKTVEILLQRSTVVSLHIRGDGTAEYEIDVKKRQGTWFENAGTSYNGSADYDDVFDTGAYAIRVRCVTGTGSANDSADILLTAGG